MNSSSVSSAHPPVRVGAALALLRETGGAPRAGGTDLMARARDGLSSEPPVDLHRLDALRGVSWNGDGSARIGALTTIAEIAGDPSLESAYPALTATAGALATPQIRAVATLGGNLLQRNRCWYYRNPAFSCHQDGGDSCPARAGDHLYSVAVDQGPCIAPHPSSMAMALLVYGATAHLAAEAEEPRLPVADLYDGSDPTRDHLLEPGRLLTAVELAPPSSGETAAYRRATARSHAEWPLVEAVARITRADGVVTGAAVAAGGVARTPLLLTEAAAALVGRPASADSADRALAGIAALCSPLPRTGYKVELLRETVREVLERALDGTGAR